MASPYSAADGHDMDALLSHWPPGAKPRIRDRGIRCRWLLGARFSNNDRRMTAGSHQFKHQNRERQHAPQRDG